MNYSSDVQNTQNTENFSYTPYIAVIGTGTFVPLNAEVT